MRLYYKDQQMNALHADIQIWMWETCWIQKENTWTKCRVIFVTPGITLHTLQE